MSKNHSQVRAFTCSSGESVIPRNEQAGKSSLLIAREPVYVLCTSRSRWSFSAPHPTSKILSHASIVLKYRRVIKSHFLCIYPHKSSIPFNKIRHFITGIWVTRRRNILYSGVFKRTSGDRCHRTCSYVRSMIKATDKQPRCVCDRSGFVMESEAFNLSGKFGIPWGIKFW